MRLEFWAALLDLIGLAVLLSHDIEILKFVESFAYKFPPLNRLRAIDQQIQDGLKTFVYQSPEIDEERLLHSFRGSAASDFVKQFPKLKKQSIPAEVDACACYVAPSTSHILEIFIWPSPKGQFTPMLADPMLDTDLITGIQKKKQNMIYAIGFTLMATGSILLLCEIIVRNP